MAQWLARYGSLLVVLVVAVLLTITVIVDDGPAQRIVVETPPCRSVDVAP